MLIQRSRSNRRSRNGRNPAKVARLNETLALGNAGMAADEERIYISVDRPLPSEITDGILAWFGMDMRRRVARYRCDDNSRYYVQAVA